MFLKESIKVSLKENVVGVGDVVVEVVEVEKRERREL